MKRLVFLFWLGSCIAPSLWAASITLAWDQSISSDVVGYRIYKGKGSRAYTEVFDAGNFLTFQLSRLIPTVQYFFAATAYDKFGLESDFSTEISYTAPMPPLTLTIDRSKITASVFAGGSFDVQISTDLKTWNLLQNVRPVQDIFTIPLSTSVYPNAFFRLKYIGLSGLEPQISARTSSKQLHELLVNNTRPKPLPPTKISIWRHLRNYLHYRGAWPIDERRGAEKLIRGIK